MRKLVTFTILAALLTSCVKPATAPLIEPCRVMRLPAYHPAPIPCGGLVCWSVEQTIELAIWINDVAEFKKAVTRCPYVETND